MFVKVYMTKEEKRLAKKHARKRCVSLSRQMKEVFFNKIIDEYDFACADAALREYEKDHKTYTHEEIKNILGL